MHISFHCRLPLLEFFPVLFSLNIILHFLLLNVCKVMLSLKLKQLFLWKSNMRCTLCTAMPQPPRLRAVSPRRKNKRLLTKVWGQRSCQGNLINQLLVTRFT